ncbi:uncharacterized protein FIBRA_02094 [Fibroporia radiculosa]|uniref:F-box domain-containing protein n=1 Tax=Fibroporia radiculosa TaxID=599839 RepID=J4HUC8_9APHY|nr:uncharacterized protein FIBRA_02094 [Fibroporia radiculosa]CCM00067.1 predicted protein [Fibroporia radiculosa]
MSRKKLKVKPDFVADAGAMGKEAGPPKTARRPVRGKRGSLQDMPNMPLDILLEIFNHLRPRDLLHLARTNKAFRGMLMSRTSAFLWKASRDNFEGLPDCPSYLSEPAYANLAFSPYCHNCLKPNIQTVLWEFSVRYCNACKQSLTMTDRSGDLYTKMGDTMVFSLLNHVDLWDRRCTRLFHKPQVLELVKNWDAVKSNEAAGQSFVEEQKARVKEVAEHASSCYVWGQKKAHSRQQELEEMKTERLRDVITRLRESGWGEELDIIAPRQYHALSSNAHVRQAKKLTTRIWQNIRQDMVDLMQDIKNQRLAEEYKTLLKRRLDTVFALISSHYVNPRRTRQTELRPPAVDLAHMPETRAIVTGSDDVELGQASQDALRDLLPTMIERWQAQVKAELTGLLQEHITSPPDIDPLDLAIACLHSRVYLMNPGDTPYDQALSSVAGCQKWSTRHLSVPTSIDDIREIVRTFGGDPSRSTRQEMDDRDVYLAAKIIYSAKAQIMTWDEAILCKSRICGLSWEQPSEDEIQRHKANQSTADEGADMWCCSLCAKDAGRLHAMYRIKDHLRSSHSVENPNVENGDMYLHPDADGYLPSNRMDFMEDYIHEYLHDSDDGLSDWELGIDLGFGFGWLGYDSDDF